MTPPRVLDEASLKEREQKIITEAIFLIQKYGIENLTMDKVVAQVPFSKGTVYKHFIGKEDLLLAICNQAIEIILDLFMRAYLFKGCARERMLLLNFSYLIYAILYPELFQSAIVAKSQSFIGKSSEVRVNEKKNLEVKLLTSLHGFIEDALSDGSLVLPAHMDIQQLCFANWSTSYGAITLLSGEIEHCSGKTGLIVERELFNNSNLLFDGMGWKPLTKDKNHSTELSLALQALFPQELALMKIKGRELNFS